MFRSKLKSSVEALQWKVKSLEEQNKELRHELEKALKTLRKHVLAVKNDAPLSDEALLYGLPFDFVSGKDLETLVAKNPTTLFLDVRTAPELQGGFIPGAMHIPVDQLPFRIEELGADRERPVITYCASGSRAQVASEMLVERGFRRVLSLKGGVASYPGKLSLPEKPKVVAIPDNLQTDNPDLAQKVQELLDGEINPGVASHGGRVSLVAVQGAKVYLRFGGGCHGCGQVDATLKHGITRRMREVLAAVEDVIDVTDHASGENPYYAAAAH